MQLRVMLDCCAEEVDNVLEGRTGFQGHGGDAYLADVLVCHCEVWKEDGREGTGEPLAY